jgi:enediyne biosynthesis protein E4
MCAAKMSRLPHFRDVTAASGFARRGWGSGVCIGDIDNDGADDVYVTAFGADAVWRNTGKGTSPRHDTRRHR